MTGPLDRLNRPPDELVAYQKVGMAIITVTDLSVTDAAATPIQ